MEGSSSARNCRVALEVECGDSLPKGEQGHQAPHYLNIQQIKQGEIGEIAQRNIPNVIHELDQHLQCL